MSVSVIVPGIGMGTPIIETVTPETLTFSMMTFAPSSSTSPSASSSRASATSSSIVSSDDVACAALSLNSVKFIFPESPFS